MSDELAVAILDTRPLFVGHVLVMPRRHRTALADLPSRDVGAFFRRVQTMAGVVESTLGAEGTFVAVNNRVSQSVPHLHVHVVPRSKGDGLRGFFWPRIRYDDEAHGSEVARTLREAYAAAVLREPATG